MQCVIQKSCKNYGTLGGEATPRLSRCYKTVKACYYNVKGGIKPQFLTI